jgi:hypothetical protein
MAVQPLWLACDAWLRRAEEVITDSADALNTLNVFPVSDSDTGSNLKLTLRGIAAAVPVLDRGHLEAVAQSAIVSAHGNSGAILAEMVASACQVLEQDAWELAAAAPGTLLGVVMSGVAAAAFRAVARPVTGTILTVAAAAAQAAQAAARLTPEDPLAVARAAQGAARTALVRTTGQLDVLARAGVVDAGGQAFVLLVDVLVEVLGGPVAEPLHDVVPPRMGTGVEPHLRPVAQGDYEVMYAVRGASRDVLDVLRRELSELGHSVVIVGDSSVAQVHVHLAQPGDAIEAALRLGPPGQVELSQIRVAALTPSQLPSARSVLSLVAGAGLAAAVRALGGVPVQGARGQLTVAELTAALEQTSGDAVVLPNDMENLEIATLIAGRLRAEGRRIAVIPTVAQVQGLAAMAVHEPSTDFDSAVVAMSTAAGHTRQGAVTIAESAAMTMAGRCQPGDVLGVVEGDFVEIGSSVVDVAQRVVRRLLAAGGELVTLVSGADAQPGLLAEVERQIRAGSHPVDVELLEGGQQRYLLLVGVE